MALLTSAIRVLVLVAFVIHNAVVSFHVGMNPARAAANKNNHHHPQDEYSSSAAFPTSRSRSRSKPTSLVALSAKKPQRFEDNVDGVVYVNDKVREHLINNND